MWPIVGDGESLRTCLHNFLGNKLKLSTEAVREADDCVIRKVPKSRNPKIASEAIVEFPSIDLRDAVRSSAFNLAGDTESGIRLEIPPHLMNNFRALNQAAYNLKKKFSTCRRNIKFDDEACDLIMEFKTSEESSWKRLRPKEAREMGGITRVKEMSVEDMSSLLRQEDDQETDSE